MRGAPRRTSGRPRGPQRPGTTKPRRPAVFSLTVALTLVLGLGLLVGCSDTLDQVTGRVVSVDSPAFGRVDGFVLATDDGSLAFDTSELEFQPAFPAVHLNEHRMLGSPVIVTYRREGERLVVTKLADA